MRRKFFFISLFISLAFAGILFVFDWAYFSHLARRNAENDLETMAASIVASELSVDLLNNFEYADNVIRDALFDQRLDRTIRVFNRSGQILFHNELAREMKAPLSPARWNSIEIDGRELRTLTIEADEYFIEVGIFLEPLLFGAGAHFRSLVLMVGAVLTTCLSIAFLVSGLVMSPLVKLSRSFTALKELSERNSETNKSSASEQVRILESLRFNDDEVGRLARELLSVLDHWQTLRETHRKDLFFLAHELKTPLTKIVFEIESIRESSQDQTTLKALDAAKDLCRSMAGFIGDYLNLSSVRSLSPQSLKYTAVTARSSIRKIIETTFSADNRRIRLGELDDTVVFAEKIHFESLFVNLVQNAVQYSDGEIQVRLRNDRLEIDDGGPGLPETIRSKIGEAFNRSDSPASTGLGLALVKGICDLYSWDLAYERRGERTVFSIVFPKTLRS